MASSSHLLLDHLRSCLDRQRGAASDDGALLRQFAQTRDDDAFAALLHRHGPMVLGLARRVVGDWQTAEDVFQATFLMLARRAPTIRRPESLSCWLHGVAFRLALRARHSQRQRQERETRGRLTSPPTPLDELTARELLSVLDEELHKLPENYRAAVILCCLEGLSQEEAAKRLGCSAGAVKGRLERGRERLRRRLAKRGLMMPAVLGGSLLIVETARALPPALLRSIRDAVRTGAGASPAAASLVQQAMRGAFVNKLKAVGVAVMLLAVMGGGVGTMALRETQTAETAAPLAALGEPPAKVEKRLDLYGDPLPPGAVMRLGTIQRRAVGAKLAVSADGKSIIGVRAGRYVSVWDADTGKLREHRQLASEFRGMSSLSADGRWLAIDTYRGDTLALWDVPTGKVVRNLTVKDVYRFTPVVFSPDGKRIAALGYYLRDERSLHVWDRESGREVWHKQFSTNYECQQLAFTPDGNRLLVSFDGMSCWDLVSGQRLWEKKSFYSDSLVITPDGKILSTMPRMPVLDLATGRSVAGGRLPPLDDGRTSQLTLSPDGRTLLLSTAKGVIVWDRDKGEEVRTLSGAGEIVVVLPDGKSIVTSNGSLQRWDLATGEPRWPDTFAQGHISEVLGVAFSADGRRLVSASADGSLRLWDVATGRQHRLWRAHPPWRGILRRPPSMDGARLLDVTPDGRWILSAGGYGYEGIKLWEASRDNEVLSLRLPPPAKDEAERYILRLRISRDGTRAIALVHPTLIQTREQPNPKTRFQLANWDARTGELRSYQAIEVKDSLSSVIAPDGRTLLVDGRLVGVASGREVGQLVNPVLTRNMLPPPKAPYAFSADGALVLSGFLDFDRKTRRPHGGARLWESATGKTIAEAAVSPHGRIAFHPDNRLLVTNDLRGIQIWDTASGKIVAARQMPEQVRDSDTGDRYASCFALTRDGQRLATGLPNGTILLWDMPALPAQRQRLTAKEAEALWADLADADAAKAWRAVWRMADAPQETWMLLRDRVKPYPTAAADETRQLLADLDGDSFERREAAAKRLRELGLRAEPALRAALKAKPSLEQKRRIEAILTVLAENPQTLSAGDLRQLRALIVLERIGTPEARRVLEDVAKGSESARLTRQARAALRCLP